MSTSGTGIKPGGPGPQREAVDQFRRRLVALARRHLGVESATAARGSFSSGVPDPVASCAICESFRVVAGRHADAHAIDQAYSALKCRLLQLASPRTRANRKNTNTRTAARARCLSANQVHCPRPLLLDESWLSTGTIWLKAAAQSSSHHDEHGSAFTMHGSAPMRCCDPQARESRRCFD